MTSDAETPSAPPVRAGSGVDSSVPKAPPAPVDPTPPTPEFTELTARRLGPVRAYFVRHPVVMDVLVMAWYGVPALLTLVTSGVDNLAPAPTTARITIAIVCMVATVAALWWRRRAPVTALAVVTTLGCATAIATLNPNGIDIAVAFCIYAVAAAGGPRRAWPAFGGATLLLVAAILLGTATSPVVGVIAADGVETSTMVYQVTGISVVAFFNLMAIAIGLSVHNRREHVSSLVERGNRLALERDQREELAVVAERSRIARELHDVVAHSLTVMITLSDGAAGIAGRDPERARTTMQDVSETGRAALADMRRVLGVLRTDDVGGGTGDGSATAEPSPLSPTPTHGVEDLVAQFRGAGMRVALVQQGGALPSDAGLRLAVYRIVQEALTNVLRYAPLSPEITVTLQREPGAVVVAVVNATGPGNRPGAAGSGRGLIGMRERVAVFGGSLEAGATPGGWRVRAVLPWEDEA
ncbi:sensor histidine kinase [Litorihabitans aurantiacus]|uniref:histidine kinase n=1 Tax=Litorihabitans aurantiacus TaxID=1930061 RepID=A0AA37USD7_9MICO|nr:histidine kinase [Litorihabitans aurantiacus]GMA30515.1 two-component sensor histidine kinase [Litorihabitans aurantiacus]